MCFGSTTHWRTDCCRRHTHRSFGVFTISTNDHSADRWQCTKIVLLYLAKVGGFQIWTVSKNTVLIQSIQNHTDQQIGQVGGFWSTTFPVESLRSSFLKVGYPCAKELASLPVSCVKNVDEHSRVWICIEKEKKPTCKKFFWSSSLIVESVKLDHVDYRNRFFFDGKTGSSRAYLRQFS